LHLQKLSQVQHTVLPLGGTEKLGKMHLEVKGQFNLEKYIA